MKKYEVWVEELLSKKILVEAENEDDAYDIGYCMYMNGEITFDSKENLCEWNVIEVNELE